MGTDEKWGQSPFPLERSWTKAWDALGLRPAAGLFETLVGHYQEAHRRYHTVLHLAECIERLEPALALAERPGEVEIALWFHDVIYNPRCKDNEQRSADRAGRALEQAGARSDVVARVCSLVMATQHSAEPATIDERLLVDVDLAILGAAPARFAEYEAQVREEYGWVPRWLFRRQRQALLRGFLHRKHIYATEHFRRLYEFAARQNLERAVA
ncbi:MAG: N-methyl-D-aspartate receptor NMDAR2C subunit [Gammaproteobacteria bacterium]|nr:MAG: N-methyl-D-aspartate receptor NMDAR2C subunit [Gammaproteobacteria bacterium]